MSGQDVNVVALAAMGCTQFVMGHNSSGKWGMLKEALAMRNALGDVPAGPGQELIRAAKEQLSGDGDSGPNIDATDKDLMVSTGRSYVEGVLPVLRALPEDAAANVRGWLIGVAERVAAASKDKGGSDKVSPEEAAAIEQLRILLAG
ncbi:hypothetical protein [Agromyces sp. SYSU T00194]|uniref:hypothetical protein n=1 Tax=Agromyces chitinivorans TaxID=3158560 RepID=UPI0033943609